MRKTSTGNQTFGNDGHYEYLLVANPSVEVHQKVMQEKTYFYDEYRERITIKTQPHITVANFSATKEMEEIIIRQLQRACAGINSFTVTLHNYSGFVPHTIYLRVQNEQPFKQLAKQIQLMDGYIAANDCPPLTVVNKPHLTIARQLSKNSYLKAIADYATRKFHASFTLNELLLIKRKHQFDKCKMVSSIKFLPPANVVLN